MLARIKVIIQEIQATITKFLAPYIAFVGQYTMPIYNRIAKWLQPITAPILAFTAPYRKQFDEKWAIFAKNSPRAALWTKRGGRVFAWLFGIYFIFWIGVFGEIPSVTELREMQTLNASEVYTADGVMIGRYYKENRTNIPYDSLPKHLIYALTSTEDARFWEHGGIDYQSFFRVVWRSIVQRDESGGGGSTLSQQLAKNLFKRKKYWFFSTPINKIREMMIASRLEKAYDKKQLLAFYMNTVPYGGTVFGIEVASKRFFNKSPKKLTHEEGAILVGMLKATTTYNPRKNPEKSRERRNVVLQQMVRNPELAQKAGYREGYVFTQAMCDSIKALPLTIDYNVRTDLGGLGAYFREYLRKELPEILKKYPKEDGTFWDIEKDGLKIYTSLDSKLQKYAEDGVEEHMKSLQRRFTSHWDGYKQTPWDSLVNEEVKKTKRYRDMKEEGASDSEIKKTFATKTPMTIFDWNEGEKEVKMSPMDSIRYYYQMLNVGFVAVEPTTGYIKAWVGGNDYNYWQYDHALAKRQVGSTFKPFVYAAAIKSGIQPCEYIPNELKSYEQYKDKEDKPWTPRNANGDYGGAYSLEGALTNSINVVSVALIMRTGVDAVRNLAKELGITSDIPREPSIALGTAEVSLLEMVRAYGTFANRGKRPEIMPILRITDASGKKVICDFTTPDFSKQPTVLTPDQADIMIRMMQSVVKEGTAGRLEYKYGVENDFAGKTGTTQSHADGWFVGFNPRIVVGAWVGGRSRAVRFRDISEGQGAATALPVCGEFLSRARKDDNYKVMNEALFVKPSIEVQRLMECSHRQYGADDFDDNNSTTTDSLGTSTPTIIEGGNGTGDDDFIEIKPNGR